ncbi:MAG TPA: DoxX family protein [Actinomycetota bacterium]|nr:DoxX family protein [Actinomycetota bacterium]
MEAGLLILRLVLAAVFVAHGTQKLFGWFGGYGLQGTGGWLSSLGFRGGRAAAAMSGGAETLGGILLGLGLLTPVGAAAAVGVMVTAIVSVHLGSGFFNGSGGYEFNLTLAAAAAALGFTGPGRWSADALLGWGLSGPGWGTAAVVVGLAGAAVILGARREPAVQTEAVEEQSQAAA